MKKNVNLTIKYPPQPEAAALFLSIAFLREVRDKTLFFHCKNDNENETDGTVLSQEERGMLATRQRTVWYLVVFCEEGAWFQAFLCIIFDRAPGVRTCPVM